MLSEQERQDLLAMARSATVREEFRQVRALSRTAAGAAPLDAVVHWLSVMNRLGPPPRPRPLAPYARALL